MNEALEWIVGLFTYFTVAGGAFRVAANRTSEPDNPWETPAPLMAGLFWPIVMPFMFGSKIPKDKSKPSKTDQRRRFEIEEAEHNRAVARINAEALAIAEKGIYE